MTCWHRLASAWLILQSVLTCGTDFSPMGGRMKTPFETLQPRRGRGCRNSGAQARPDASARGSVPQIAETEKCYLHTGRLTHPRLQQADRSIATPLCERVFISIAGRFTGIMLVRPTLLIEIQGVGVLILSTSQTYIGAHLAPGVRLETALRRPNREGQSPDPRPCRRSACFGVCLSCARRV